MSNQSTFTIAAVSSGAGKTTFSLGMMRACTRMGKTLQPFKCGPDYIDPLFHASASGRQSINLDAFMGSEAHIKDLFQKHSLYNDVNIIEGVMGLFDGYSKMKGSTAHISSIIQSPVVLLIDAKSSAYSTAAVIHGFRTFSDIVDISGIVFNRVSSHSHLSTLKSVCDDMRIRCFGGIPNDPALGTPSRHLGLSLTEDMEGFIERAADIVEKHIDIPALLAATSQDRKAQTPKPRIVPADRPQISVAIARDEAFNFIYPANVDSIANHPRYDCRIEYFSPLHDLSLPQCDILYLPGGYPELFTTPLSANSLMRGQIKKFAEGGGRIYAECGGMMYLSSDIDGHEMCGILPFSSTMNHARLTLGYRQVHFNGHTFKDRKSVV